MLTGPVFPGLVRTFVSSFHAGWDLKSSYLVRTVLQPCAPAPTSVAAANRAERCRSNQDAAIVAAPDTLGLRIHIIVSFTRTRAWLRATERRRVMQAVRDVTGCGERDETDFRFAFDP